MEEIVFVGIILLCFEEGGIRSLTCLFHTFLGIPDFSRKVIERIMFARSMLGSFGIASKLSVCKNIASRACVAHVHTLNHIPILNANMENMRVYLEPSTGKKPTCSVMCYSAFLSYRSLCSMDWEIRVFILCPSEALAFYMVPYAADLSRSLPSTRFICPTGIRSYVL